MSGDPTESASNGREEYRSIRISYKYATAEEAKKAAKIKAKERYEKKRDAIRKQRIERHQAAQILQEGGNPTPQSHQSQPSYQSQQNANLVQPNGAMNNPAMPAMPAMMALPTVPGFGKSKTEHFHRCADEKCSHPYCDVSFIIPVVYVAPKTNTADISQPINIPNPDSPANSTNSTTSTPNN